MTMKNEYSVQKVSVKIVINSKCVSEKWLISPNCVSETYGNYGRLKWVVFYFVIDFFMTQLTFNLML